MWKKGRKGKKVTKGGRYSKKTKPLIKKTTKTTRGRSKAKKVEKEKLAPVEVPEVVEEEYDLDLFIDAMKKAGGRGGRKDTFTIA